jgi:hypothetical protein
MGIDQALSLRRHPALIGRHPFLLDRPAAKRRALDRPISMVGFLEILETKVRASHHHFIRWLVYQHGQRVFPHDPACRFRRFAALGMTIHRVFPNPGQRPRHRLPAAVLERVLHHCHGHGGVESGKRNERRPRLQPNRHRACGVRVFHHTERPATGEFHIAPSTGIERSRLGCPVQSEFETLAEGIRMGVGRWWAEIVRAVPFTDLLAGIRNVLRTVGNLHLLGNHTFMGLVENIPHIQAAIA